MIVTDNNPSMDRKAAPPSTAPAAPPPARDVPPLPEYARAHQSLLPHYVIDPHEELRVGRETKKRAVCRFFKAFAIAAVIWVLLGSFVRGVVRSVKYKDWDDSWGIGDVEGPTREDGHTVSCIDGYSWSHDDDQPPRDTGFGQKEVRKTFELPLDADLLYLLSRGTYSHGNINIVPVIDSDRKVAVVDIKATYSHDELIEASRVCLLSRHDAEHGLGIYTPQRRWSSWPNRNRSLNWDIKVSIPDGTDLKALSTALHIFTHTIDGKHLKFGNLALSSTNAHMNLTDIIAGIATISTTNAPIFGSLVSNTTSLSTTNGRITGSYNATNSLFLHTTNGAILVDAHLTNSAGSSAHPSVVLETTNGKIDSSVSLYSTAKDAKDESFVVTARTTNAPFNLTIPALPTDAKLDFIGHTTNNRATAKIHPAWEGRLFVKTSSGKTMVNTRDFNAKDPRGEGRERHLDDLYYEKKIRMVTGTVRWGEGREEERKGSVTLESSNGSVELVL